MTKVAVLFLFFALVYTASALECYKCQSFNGYDKNCDSGENLDNKKEQCMENSNQDAVCVKYVTKAKNSEQKNVTRACVTYPKGQSPQECHVIAGFEKVSCDTCNSNLCNEAAILRVNFFAAAVAMALSCLAAKMYLL